MDAWQLLVVLLGGGGAVAVLTALGAGIKWLVDTREHREECHRKSCGQFKSGREDYIRALELEKEQRFSLVSIGDDGVEEKSNPDDPYKLRDKARDSFREAMLSGPDRKTKAQILYYQVRMLYDEGIRNKETCDVCVEELNDALELNKRLGLAYLLRGQIYEECGDKERALQDREHYRRFNPHDEDNNSRIQYLRKEIGIAEKPTTWQKWQSVTGRTTLCTSLA